MAYGMQASIEPGHFEELFMREYRGVVAAARRIVGLATAEDIAQEAFAALYRAGVNDSVHARNWLYRTTLHRAISALRSQQRRAQREGIAASVTEGSTAQDPSGEIERGEMGAAVHATLRRMRPRYAQILALRHSGLPYREIAEIMDVKVNQVGTLLVRAEAAFRKEYDRVSSAT